MLPPPTTSKILIYHTGGTIGMAETGQGLAPDPGFPDRLRNALALAGPLPCDYEIKTAARQIDSSQATTRDWRDLAGALQDQWNGFDGFVVTHGTDTLAFTAAALTFMIATPNKPVILTGAQTPLQAPGSDALGDGLGNVICALYFAANGPSCVGLAFAGDLYLGARATKVSSIAPRAFASPNANAVRCVRAQSEQSAKFFIPDDGDHSIAALRVSPAFHPAAFTDCLNRAPRGIILECYGLGGAPNFDGALAAFLSAARARKIPVVAVSQASHGGVALGRYAAGSALAQGAVDGGDMTFEAATAKLWWLSARNLDYDEICAEMARNVASERSER